MINSQILDQAVTMVQKANTFGQLRKLAEELHLVLYIDRNNKGNVFKIYGKKRARKALIATIKIAYESKFNSARYTIKQGRFDLLKGRSFWHRCIEMMQASKDHKYMMKAIKEDRKRRQLQRGREVLARHIDAIERGVK